MKRLSNFVPPNYVVHLGTLELLHSRVLDLRTSVQGIAIKIKGRGRLWRLVGSRQSYLLRGIAAGFFVLLPPSLVSCVLEFCNHGVPVFEVVHVLIIYILHLF